MDRYADDDLLVTLEQTLLGVEIDSNRLFVLLDARYQDRLVGYLRWLGLRCAEDCEDLIQEVWKDLFKMIAAETLARFFADDIQNLSLLVDRLRRRSDPIAQFVGDMLPVETKELLDDPSSTSEELRTSLISGLNELLEKPSLYASERFRDIEVSASTQNLLALRLQGGSKRLLNRLLLQDAFKQELSNAISSERLEKTVLRIARTNAYDFFRRSRREVQKADLEDKPLDALAGAEPDEEREKQWELVEHHLTRIFEDLRPGVAKNVAEIQLLHLRHGLSIRDICQKLWSRQSPYTESQVKRAHGYLVKLIQDAIRQ
jgi:DNA-directed RNA polymerase specialized sigma24 family protein